MATFDLPIGSYYEKADFFLQTNTEIFRSPLNGAKQRLERAGAYWVAEYTTRRLNSAETALFEAFFAKLKGSLNDFYAYDPLRTTPLGTGVGTPLVNGAGQTGGSLNTDGWGISQKVLKAGDRFEAAGKLRMMIQDADTNGSGEVTLYFEPPFEEAPADNAVITISTPKCLMCLSGNDEGKRQTEVDMTSTFTFRCEEVFETTSYLLTENGDYMLTENGDRIII